MGLFGPDSLPPNQLQITLVSVIRPTMLLKKSKNDKKVSFLPPAKHPHHALMSSTYFFQPTQSQM
jgi:hypothetical protein